MHRVELLDEALQLAKRLGYAVRHEWLGGSGGGGCVVKGRKLLFVDLAVDVEEQLQRVLDALRQDDEFAEVAGEVDEMLRLRKAA